MRRRFRMAENSGCGPTASATPSAGGTIVSPFIVLALFRNYGVRGVLALMIGLLIINVIVIAVWGIEPANGRLEDSETTQG